MPGRTASIERNTKETQLRVAVNLDGPGKFTGKVGVPFLEHMLDLLARHGRMDIAIEGQGDIQIDPHHTVEDLGIVLGQAFAKALGDKRSITRFGSACIPMEETLARCVVDVCGRPYLQYNVAIGKERIGEYDVELTEDFFRAIAMNAGLTLHLELLYGKNSHHVVEALFKAFARALRLAFAIDPGPKEFLRQKVCFKPVIGLIGRTGTNISIFILNRKSLNASKEHNSSPYP